VIRALQLEDGTYAPAHALPDGRLERAGRVSTSNKASGGSTDNPNSSGERNCSSFARTAAILVIGDELLSGKVWGYVNTSI